MTDPISSGSGAVGDALRRGAGVVRHPVRALRTIAGQGPLYPLLILFALNAVDELDRSAFYVLIPEIRDEFELGFQGLLTFVGAVNVLVLALAVPIAGLADRYSRVRIALAGALAWSVFSFSTGLATGILFLGFVRSGSAIGASVVPPTHNPLLSDWFPPADRPRVFAFHRSANVIGASLGFVLAGQLGYHFGWRTPFLILAIPTLVVVLAALRLRDPVRGAHERRAAGAEAEAVDIEEPPPSITEAWRMCWKIATLRRIFAALPFLAAGLTALGLLNVLYIEEVFGLDERARGNLFASIEPVVLIGLIIGARAAGRFLARGPGRILHFLAITAIAQGCLFVGYALAPNLAVAVAFIVPISICGAILAPGMFTVMSMAIPPRARAMGFSMGSLWILPGLLILPFIGWIADNWGIRQGMLVLLPVSTIGALIVASAGSLIGEDIDQVQRTAAARSEVLLARRRGDRKVLLCRDLQVSYGEVQVLFDVDFEVEEGAIVALLGTNGAGKSTLLKAISGIVEAERGAVILDGREITHAPPNEIAAHGVSQLPGGIGVFPSLTVGENLRSASWLNRRSNPDAARDRVLERFPQLANRLGDRAGDLSGGQQQMLGLAMAFLTRPRLLMIDELTLGLAPVVVEELLPLVREVRDEGVTVILVEQSVNTALTLAETAYFMEKGQIRFHGPTVELLQRPDILRSVFLEGAAAGVARAEGQLGDDQQVDRKPRRSPVDSAGATPVLKVVGMCRSFGGIRAVDDVNLEVFPNEILGLIGPNGAGKTTLFDLICGFTSTDAGTVLVDRQSLDGCTPATRARIGLGRSFQDARLFPALTVEETLAVALDRWVTSRDPVSAALRLPHSYRSERRTTARVGELVELMGLGPYRSKFVNELSTGTRRIVDLACVVAHQPVVVLLDEPSSGIAQREAEALAPVIRGIRDKMGCALVVVEHDMALLRSVADRMVALDQGAVVAEGPPAVVLEHPAVVASYLGSDPTALTRSDPI